MTATDKSSMLVGTWKLMDITNKDADGNILRSSYGPDKMGLISFNENNCMMVVIRDGSDVTPTDRPLEYSSYTGRFTFDGTTLITHVEGSLPLERTGTDQVRPTRFEGNKVILTAPPVEIDGVVNFRDLTWEKIA